MIRLLCWLLSCIADEVETLRPACACSVRRVDRLRVEANAKLGQLFGEQQPRGQA